MPAPRCTRRDDARSRVAAPRAEGLRHPEEARRRFAAQGMKADEAKAREEIRTWGGPEIGGDGGDAAGPQKPTTQESVRNRRLKEIAQKLWDLESSWLALQ